MATSSVRIPTADVVPFPRQKKRGRKVTRGRAAEVITLPLAFGDHELESEWVWLHSNHASWACEQIGSELDDKKVQFFLDIGRGFAIGDGKPFNNQTMRVDVARWKAVIEHRIAMKDWLEDLGATAQDLRSAEDAVEFLHARFASKPKLVG